MHNAWQVGKRLNDVCKWWRDAGKPENSFIRWVHNHLIGSELGSMHESEFHDLLSFARLVEQFPNIIFITSMSWRTLARNPGKFFNFVTADPGRQHFWTTAQYNFKVKTTPNSPAVQGPAMNRAGTLEKIELMSLEPEYQEMQSLYIRGRKEALERQVAFGDEIEMIQEDLNSDD